MCQSIFYRGSKVKASFFNTLEIHASELNKEMNVTATRDCVGGSSWILALASGLTFVKDHILPGSHPSSYTVEQSSHQATSINVCVSVEGCARFSKDSASNWRTTRHEPWHKQWFQVSCVNGNPKRLSVSFACFLRNTYQTIMTRQKHESQTAHSRWADFNYETLWWKKKTKKKIPAFTRAGWAGNREFHFKWKLELYLNA